MSSSILAYIDGMDHGVIDIVGRGKTFKSGTLYSLFEYCPRLMARSKAFYRFPDVSVFPEHLRAYSVDHFDDVIPGSILIIEDANRVFPSRNSSRNPELQEFMGLISHKDILVILTVQNTNNTDIAFFRDQDIVTIHKLMNPSAIANERPELQAHCLYANLVIDSVSKALNVTHHYVSYVPRWSDKVLVMDRPPAYYGPEISHALRNYSIRSKGVV